MMQRLKGVIQLLVAAALVALVVWANVKPNEGQRIEDATPVEDAQVLAENEGKRVIVSGTVQVKDGAVDPDLNIAFASPIVRRSVECLHYVDEWEWVGVSEWSTNHSLTDATIAGKVSIGQFDLNPKLLRTLPVGERDWDEADLDAQTLDRLKQSWYFNTVAGQLYISQVPSFDMDWAWPLYQNLEGSYRVRYRVWNTYEGLEMTVVGVQRGTTLYFDENLDASPAYEGILDTDELVASNKRAALLGEIIFAGIPAVVLIILGIRNVREL